MISLEPVTAGTSGYAELFQVGEALNGRPLSLTASIHMTS
jgi:hypothetical protein